jgi:integrase
MRPEMRCDRLPGCNPARHAQERRPGDDPSDQCERAASAAEIAEGAGPKSAFVFVNERGTPFDREGFNWLVKRTGKKAGLPFQAHAHMLRDAAGYTLANAGKDTRSPGLSR